LVSLQAKIKIYIAFSLMIYIITAISIFTIDLYVNNAVQEAGIEMPETVELLNKLYIFNISLVLGALVLGLYILVFVFIRGINKYKEYTRRLMNLQKQGRYSLEMLQFPKEDEFGNIGTHLNYITAQIMKFDMLKTQKIKTENQKFRIISDRLLIPVLTISNDGGSKIIKHYNKKFQELFIPSSKENGFFTNLTNSVLSTLRIRKNDLAKKDDNIEDDGVNKFIDAEFNQAIDLAITNSSEMTIKKEIYSLNGQKTYYCEDINIIPVVTEENRVFDVLIIFNKIKRK
jgi:hypothetical protein